MKRYCSAYCSAYCFLKVIAPLILRIRQSVDRVVKIE